MSSETETTTNPNETLDNTESTMISIQPTVNAKLMTDIHLLQYQLLQLQDEKAMLSYQVEVFYQIFRSLFAFNVIG